MIFFKGMKAVFLKDLNTELRTRYALNTVLAFTGSSLLLILFALRANELPENARAGIIWIIILFAALSGLSRSFVSETERHTYNLLRLHSNASEIFAGKLIYNFTFTLSVNLAAFILYIFFLNITVESIFALLLTIVLGSAGLCGVSTFLAAVVSQADRKGAIFSVLSLPLLFPLILVLVDATKTAIFIGMNAGFLNNIAAITGYSGATIAAGFLLFDYIWEE